ncbi:MAG: isochorismatase family protein, partial [Chloroflexi bacterium]|nr:isochorismatase family protein [Chloroflexota bacterium]
DELTPSADDILLTKWRYSAFQRTDLLDMLREQGRDQLVICGIYGHIGCLMTASEAFMQDVQPFLVADAIADFSLADHQMALSYAAKRCAVTIATEQLLAELGSAQILRSEQALAEADAALTFERVCADLADVLDEPDLALDADTNLIDLGLDSIRIMSLIERWRRDGVEVSFMELIDRPTLGEWWQLLAARSSQVAAH